jgi:hypothetical protein
VLLPRAVHADALHAVAVAVAAHLLAGAVVDQYRQSFRGWWFFHASLHGFPGSRCSSLRNNFMLLYGIPGGRTIFFAVTFTFDTSLITIRHLSISRTQSHEPLV